MNMKQFDSLSPLAQAYVCGWEACKRGMDMRFCPFDKNEQEYGAFYIGWTDASELNRKTPHPAEIDSWNHETETEKLIRQNCD